MKPVNQELEGNTPVWEDGRWIEPDEVLDTGAESRNESTETDGAPSVFDAILKLADEQERNAKQRAASHLSQSDADTALHLDKTESFSEWIDSKGDSLAPADSFDEWLREREDAI